MTTPRKKVAKRTKPLGSSSGLWLEREGRDFLGSKRIRLLEAIAEHGSITHAARAAGLSYKAAWDAVDAMNNLADEALVTRAVGGAQGGGSQLTEHGKEIVRLYRQVETAQHRVLAQAQADAQDASQMSGLLGAITLRTSARNQLRGTIRTIRKGAVNADVTLDLGDGLLITANISCEAVDLLELTVGKHAIALIKSSFVLLTTDSQLRISARNRLQGTVTAIIDGAVNSEVKLQLPGGRTLVAIVTVAGLRSLGLEVGQPCCAIIKASHVLIAVND